MNIRIIETERPLSPRPRSMSLDDLQGKKYLALRYRGVAMYYP